MAAPANYMVVVKDQNGNLYEFEKATDLAWEWYENDVGRCRFHIPYNDVKLTTTSIPQNAFSEIRIYRNGTMVWQGFIAFVRDTKDGTIVWGLTYLECLKWYTQNLTDSADIGPFQIGAEIIDTFYEGALVYTNNILAAKITKGTIENPYDTGTSTAKTISRSFYNDRFFDICQEMVAVSRADSPSGAWKQDTVFEITFSTTPTFNFWRDVGTDKSNVIFELDSEIVNFAFDVDMRELRNNIQGFAVGEGPVVLQSSQTDTTSRTTYYNRSFFPFYGDVTNQVELDERVKNDLTELKDPTKNISIQLASNITPFDGYSMGDAIKVRINRGRVSVDEFYRVIGMEVNRDTNGVEIVNPILQKKRT